VSETKVVEIESGKCAGYADPWRALALAVIGQAVRDIRYLGEHPESARRRRMKDVERTVLKDAQEALAFLHSAWGGELVMACEFPGQSWKTVLRELDGAMAPWAKEKP